MIPRRFVARLSSSTPASTALLRPFSSTPWPQKAPALSDVEPDQAHVFDAKQKEFRDNVTEMQRRKKDQERQSAQSQSQSASSAAKSSSNPSATTEYLDAAGLGSLSLSAGEAQRKQDPNGDKKSGRLSSFIYGTEEGREMDREIERSFSQTLARGKYVHSIVVHDVKPDKVDEYVDLVGSWYPRMADMPENKVHLVGSWRTEVGDCDQFGTSEA